MSLVNYLFKNSQQIIDEIRNVMSFGISLYTYYSAYQYYYNNDPQYISTSLYLIVGHCISDTFLLNESNSNLGELYIHHLSAVGLITFQLYYQPLKDNFYPCIFICVELSSSFLVLKSWLKGWPKWIVQLNNILFLITFFYTRVYLYSVYILFDRNLENILSSYTNTILCKGWYYGSLYVFYGLNMYWAMIIFKVFFKAIKNLDIFSAINCERALEYSYFSSLIYSIYKYSTIESVSVYSPESSSYDIGSIFLFDIFGQTLLVASSSYYHGELRKRLIQKAPSTSVDVLEDNKILWVYLEDIICINIRTFLCAFTNLNLFYNDETIKMRCFLIGFSLVNHLVTVFYYIKFIVGLKMQNETFGLDEQITYKTYIINLLIGLPILVDNLLVIYNTDDCIIRNSLSSILMMLGILSYVRPAYQANHLMLHITLFLQTYYLTSANFFKINSY